MDSTSASPINDILKRQIVEDYDSFSIVTIPGLSQLPAQLRNEALKRIQQQENMLAARPCSAALVSALERMTPPVDEDLDHQDAVSTELIARKMLKREGCPPCYPAQFEIPFRELPERYRPIVSYWKSFPGTVNLVLQAQLSDWKRFLEFQRSIRRYYRKRPFSGFVDQLRERRRRHGMEDSGSVRWDSRKTKLKTWFEYQDWHLQRLEGMEKSRNKIRDALRLLETRGAEEGGELTEAEVCLQDLEHAEWELKRQHILVHWIEEERRKIDVRSVFPRGRNGLDTEQVYAADGMYALDRQGVNLSELEPKSAILKRYSGRAQKPQQRTSAQTALLRPYQLRRSSASLQILDRETQRCLLPCLSHVRTRSGRISRRPTRWGFPGS